MAWEEKWGPGVGAGAEDRLARVHQMCPQTPESPSPCESPCEVASLLVVMMNALKTGPVPVTSVSASPRHGAWGRAKLHK